MTGTDAMLKAVRDWFRAHFPGDDAEVLLVKGRSGRKVKHSFPLAITAPGDEETFVDQPPQPAPPVRTVSREPTDAEEAIKLALFYAGHRRTGPELINDVQERYPNRWSDGHIVNTTSKMATDGLLQNYARDPGDDFGKGYGLTDWKADTTSS